MKDSPYTSAPAKEDRLYNPQTKETITFLTTTQQSGGAYFLIRVELEPHAQGGPIHYHTRFVEEFTAERGVLAMHYDGSEKQLEPKARQAIPLKVIHGFSNKSDEEIAFTTKVTPARRMEKGLRIFCGLAADRAENNIAQNWWHDQIMAYYVESYSPDRPYWLQRIQLWATYHWAKLLGKHKPLNKYLNPLNDESMKSTTNNKLGAIVTLLALLSCSTVAQQLPSTAVNDDQQIGKRFEVTMADLPKPYASEAVRNSPLSVARQGKMPKLPEGFTATLFAENLEHPRQVLILPNGDVMAVCQNPGYLMMMRDDDGDGQADWIEKHAGGFNRPYGIAHREGELLVTDQDGIWAIDYTDGSLRPPYPLSQKASEVPKDERVPSPNMDGQRMISKKGIFGLVQGHNNRDIAVAPDGQLFVGVGSSGNIGEEPEPKATIQVFNASASNQQTYASGMRNACGLAVHPTTGDLWAIVQERDGFGDQLVPDFFTKVQEGGFYGFPYAYIGNHPQPGFAEKAPEKVEETVTPDFLFEPHSAAMDAVFYQGKNFPSDYQGDAFVALHGSWNRADPTGYKVVRVKFENGSPTGWYDNFMTGFWTQGDDKAVVWGRPADVAVAPDGALFVVDDVGGTIWRVTYAGE